MHSVLRHICRPCSKQLRAADFYTTSSASFSSLAAAVHLIAGRHLEATWSQTKCPQRHLTTHRGFQAGPRTSSGALMGAAIKSSPRRYAEAGVDKGSYGEVEGSSVLKAKKIIETLSSADRRVLRIELNKCKFL